ncbi:sigma-70 family RNA polymerase sigma factor [Sphingobium sp.]|uniref:RNA polymerase sigma factor n=1 Tax=Sphingobium sp. TaxID=1912891 RepID=UPI00262FD6FF|nr:sigma-70 family RNA polymerase sigma factor [Sphingobium sp.]
MRPASEELVAWVGRHILPHERQLRSWLSAAFPSSDVDDVVQEAYCRIANLKDVGHVDDPRRYLFRTARNIVLEQIRRDRVVRIEAASGLSDLENALEADHISPERVVSDRQMLTRVERLIASLPDRGQRIFRMRKIEGIAQKEIAAALGLTETIVENEVARGLRRIVDALTSEERAELPLRRNHKRKGRAHVED